MDNKFSEQKDVKNFLRLCELVITQKNISKKDLREFEEDNSSIVKLKQEKK